MKIKVNKENTKTLVLTDDNDYYDYEIDIEPEFIENYLSLMTTFEMAQSQLQEKIDRKYR